MATGINLPKSGNVQLPQVPESIRGTNAELYDYLSKMRISLQQVAQDQFANSFIMATAMNLGTSGTFVTASGGHIVITSGIVISVSTT